MQTNNITCQSQTNHKKKPGRSRKREKQEKKKMKQAVILFLVVIFVPTILSFSKPPNVCHYKSTKGVDFDLRILNHTTTDLQYFDAASSTTFYFSPCGVVSVSSVQIENSCPKGSSMCMITSQGKSVNFGSVNAVQWSDGVEDGASIEAIYGNGEQCNNGIPRKTIVEYVCDLNKLETASAIQSVSLIDDCTAKMTIRSAYACPVKTFCKSLSTLDSCVNTDKLCYWSASGKCEPTTGCIGWKRFTENAGGVVMIVILSVIAAALACTCGLCVCCCIRKKSRRMRNRKCMLMKRSNKKSARTPSKKRTVKKQDQEVEYAPFQMPVQLVPGGFAPVNPYSNIQGYPMVTLVAPTGEEEQV